MNDREFEQILLKYLSPIHEAVFHQAMNLWKGGGVDRGDVVTGADIKAVIHVALLKEAASYIPTNPHAADIADNLKKF